MATCWAARLWAHHLSLRLSWPQRMPQHTRETFAATMNPAPPRAGLSPLLHPAPTRSQSQSPSRRCSLHLAQRPVSTGSRRAGALQQAKHARCTCAAGLSSRASPGSTQLLHAATSRDASVCLLALTRFLPCAAGGALHVPRHERGLHDLPGHHQFQPARLPPGRAVCAQALPRLCGTHAQAWAKASDLSATLRMQLQWLRVCQQSCSPA